MDTCASLALPACGVNRRLRVCLLSCGSTQSHPSQHSVCAGTGNALGKPSSSGQPRWRAPCVLLTPIGRRNGKESSPVELMLGGKAYLFYSTLCILESKSSYALLWKELQFKKVLQRLCRNKAGPSPWSGHILPWPSYSAADLFEDLPLPESQRSLFPQTLTSLAWFFHYKWEIFVTYQHTVSPRERTMLCREMLQT